MEKGLCAPRFHVLEVSEQKKLAACEIPPSVMLFIHAARAICFVSGWKVCWDHGLIVLFAELIVLFDLSFSWDACERRKICLAQNRRVFNFFPHWNKIEGYTARNVEEIMNPLS